MNIKREYLPSGSKNTSAPKIRSTGAKVNRQGDMRPQVSPMTHIPERLFIWQLLRQLSKHSENSALSDNVTCAPHFAATIPGRLTPAPI